MWNSPGQGSNLPHSSDPSCRSDNSRPLTHCATREILPSLKIKSYNLQKQKLLESSIILKTVKPSWVHKKPWFRGQWEECESAKTLRRRLVIRRKPGIAASQKSEAVSKKKKKEYLNKWVKGGPSILVPVTFSLNAGTVGSKPTSMKLKISHIQLL